MQGVARKVEFYRHSLTDEDIAEVADALRGVFLTTGPRTAAFETALANYLGIGEAVGLSSCTDALFLCLKALGAGAAHGDEVITVPMTFIATPNTILQAGAVPVFVDVERDTGNIDVDAVERAITPRTRGVMPVHLYGTMVDMTRLADLCRRRGLFLIEDAAHTLEATRDGVRPGELGDAVCFSFYATKNLTCGEGGAVATNNPEIARIVRMLRQHGMSKSAAERYTGRYQHWDMVDLGYKANMSDIQAALLIKQLPRLAAQLDRREVIARRYEEAFADMPGIQFPRVPRTARSARHLFTIWVPPEHRDETVWQLQEDGIGVAVNYRAVHLLTYYRERYGFSRGAFPIAERIGDSTITLPLYPKMLDEDVEAVVAAVRRVAAKWPRS